MTFNQRTHGHADHRERPFCAHGRLLSPENMAGSVVPYQTVIRHGRIYRFMASREIEQRPVR